MLRACRSVIVGSMARITAAMVWICCLVLSFIGLWVFGCGGSLPTGARLAQMGRGGNKKNAHFLRTEGKEELASECIV